MLAVGIRRTHYKSHSPGMRICDQQLVTCLQHLPRIFLAFKLNHVRVVCVHVRTQVFGDFAPNVSSSVSGMDFATRSMCFLRIERRLQIKHSRPHDNSRRVMNAEQLRIGNKCSSNMKIKIGDFCFVGFNAHALFIRSTRKSTGQINISNICCAIFPNMHRQLLT